MKLVMSLALSVGGSGANWGFDGVVAVGVRFIQSLCMFRGGDVVPVACQFEE